MRRRDALTLVAGAVIAVGISGHAAAQDLSVDFSVSGTSTIRGWTCTVPGTAEVERGGDPVAGLDQGVSAATLVVRVADFECPEEQMREHLLEAMRAEEFPEITFTLTGLTPGGGSSTTTGELTILDTTQSVSFPFSISTTGGVTSFEGELPLDMTTYGVEPPEVMLGLLVVRPQIRIQFTGTVAGQARPR